MKSRFLFANGIAIVLGLLQHQPSLAADLAVDFYPAEFTSGPISEYPYTLGWSFTVLHDVSVTSLGFLDGSANSSNRAPYNLALWTDSGTLLASALLPTNNDVPIYFTPHALELRFVDITPVTLSSGQTYRIGAEYTYSPYVSGYVDLLSAGPFVDNNIVFGSAARSSLGAGLAFPGTLTGSNQGYFGPDFLLTPVPEPDAVAVIAIGITLWGLRRKRRGLARGPQRSDPSMVINAAERNTRQCGRG